MEQLNSILDMILTSPVYGLWAFGLFILWKLSTLASWVYAIKFTIQYIVKRYYDNKDKPKDKDLIAIELEEKKLDLEIKKEAVNKKLAHNFNTKLNVMFSKNCYNGQNAEQQFKEILDHCKGSDVNGLVHSSTLRQLSEFVRENFKHNN